MKTKFIILLITGAILLGCYSTCHATIIAHWDFEEGSGSVANDSVNSLNGTISYATYTTGKVGNYALDFNGFDSFVEISNNSLLEPGSLAISLWFSSRGSQNPFADMLDKGHGSGSTPEYAGYVIQYGANLTDYFVAYYGDDIQDTFLGAISDSGYTDNQWHHLVTNLGSALELYIDGVLLSAVTQYPLPDPLPPIVGNDSNLYFGRHRTLGALL